MCLYTSPPILLPFEPLYSSPLCVALSLSDSDSLSDSVYVMVVLNSYLLSLCSLFHSDYIIEEKNAVLQKKDNEGFGFVLRGAKGETQTHTLLWKVLVFTAHLPSMWEAVCWYESWIWLSLYCYTVSQQHEQLQSTLSLSTQIHSGLCACKCARVRV